ncbi:hypothetical protein B0T16DRAFT_332013 [Cercophora newfieldiana]|uniref:BZIP domain-containing protein n=1 Tax=Cercophora newfieldiana TaxID=92897 RepID=A0AA39Y3R7_9PEZI|nr:hypothetical protein B0T16DRAFT_332013 [Cercophora newfieldiana]
MRYPTGDLAILSAEVYASPGIPFGRAGAAKKGPPPGGPSEDGPRKRARVQSSTDGGEHEEEKKRARGRPRLDVKDETAADRRRTQIRLAQRAYRNRKENAIQTLEKRVQELKDTNEEMSNVFLQLHDFAVGTGALDRIPEFGRQLRQTTEKFLALARKASEDGAKDDEAADGSSGDGTKGRKTSGRGNREASSSPEPVDRTQQNVDDTTRKPQQPLLYGGFTITHEPLSEQDLIADFSTNYVPPPTTSALDFEVITQPTLENASFPFGTAPEFDFSGFSNPSPSPYNTLPLPRTYTSQEATFGRRLQRFACERALVLISMPNPPPERFSRVFGFSLLVETKEDIHRRLRGIVDRNMQENLFNWQYPFYNLGGAGTHFGTDSVGGQRAGNQGTIDVLKPQNSAGFATGPFRSGISDVQNSTLDKDMRVDFPGFRGDFFDCDEVELYLRQRGVTIPPGADHITIEIDPSGFSTNSISATTLYPSPPSNSYSSDNSRSTNTLGLLSPPASGAGSSSLSPASSVDGAPTTVPSTQPPSTSPWMLGSANSLVDPLLSGIFSQSTGSSYIGMTATSSAPDFANLESTGVFGYTSSASAPRRRETVMVDVNLLITKMTEFASCLGRSPGFRPADINTAFWKAARTLGN